jgi:hypothetical protein
VITKILEVRDKMTFISVLAISTRWESEEQRYYLARAGYDRDGSIIILVRLADCKASCDPYEWSPGDSRTMPHAHDYIEKHFDELKDGDVVDVRVILGETDMPALSERLAKACQI